ncbi:two-component sensor histidine kinase [Deinococcus malanensis]|uniref:histidine kinase n=1 Tax=Deinococcus malanensis TaxID=1706855 RepID=A0ABQ2ERK2_9DEIO|nr:HAMP domain-containing sensor histidine kinase [Deinococcus malanensis]GGK18596.1 two-component sensor histidine kinase [Deinococcus malanensis]
MGFFMRLLLSHLMVILLAVAGVFVSVELIAPGFYRAHVEEMVQTLGPAGAGLRGHLEHGLRSTLTRALWASLPLSVLVAAIAAYVSSRRVVGSVETLRRRSRALAQGDYRQRVQATGRDELADLAHHFNVLAAALERVEQGRTELIGNVAHELRAPLTALRGYADAIDDHVLPPEHAARAISREVAAMERLVRDLSLVSRVEAGQMELHLEPVPLEALLQAVRERFTLAFEEKDVDLHIPSGNEDPPLPDLHADQERTLQVLTNILGNALRHTPPGGQVGLEVRRLDTRAAITVSDTGPGIAANHLPRLFERFYRVDPARSRLEAGSGVGLTIARGLAEAMGGTLTAESRPGQGSAFTLTLPLHLP